MTKLNDQLEYFAVHLSNYMDNINEFYSWLDFSEKKRADKFKFPVLKQNYILSHGLLRHHLSRITGTHPGKIEFSYSRYGKPYLRSLQVHFNMSHSHEMAMYAFSTKGEVGVDIQYDPEIANDIPVGFLPLFMQYEINQAEKSKQREVFYLKWVELEAFLKAKGVGFCHEVSLLDSSCFDGYEQFEISLPAKYSGSIATKK